MSVESTQNRNTGSSTEERTVFLVDGTAYIYRAYHAIRGLTTTKGFPTNAIYGYTQMLVKLLSTKQPVWAAVCFDSREPTFRHRRYEAYKANRPPMPEDLSLQIEPILEITRAFHLPVLTLPGYEADDVIGTLAMRAARDGYDVVIVSGDKDFSQLVSERIRIWDPMKDTVIDLETVRNNYGVEPRQIVDIMGLSGDTSDNVPGVPGIGPKTASTLISRFGSIEALYEHIDTIPSKNQREKLLAHRESAFLSRELVTICTEAPIDGRLEDFRVGEPIRERLMDLFGTFEFRQLQQTYAVQKPITSHPPESYHAVQSKNALVQLADRLRESGRFAIDTETTSEHPMLAGLVGISVSDAPGHAWYVPIGHSNVAEQLTLADVVDVLGPILSDPRYRKIGQNIKYDWIVLERHGFRLDGVHSDTMIASYLLNPSKRSHSLDQIALDYLNRKAIGFDTVTQKGKIKVFSHVPLDEATRYACQDADFTLQADKALLPLLKREGLVNLFETVEMPLVHVLKKMEMEGVCVDRERLRRLSNSFQQEMDHLEEAVYEKAGERFNLQSHQQLGRILFEKLKLPTQKKTKKRSGYSTDVDVLTELALHHELPNLVLRHRTIAKLKSTYTDSLIDMVHPKTGRIHTSYNQTVTATGRLSSSDPNLQNIPVRTEEGRMIREAFVPRPGWKMVSADYSQIELRILAHCSEDPLFVSAFLEDKDIHTRTASEVFQVPEDAVTPELRRQAKTVNFGILYGMGAYSLSKDLGISVKMAKSIIDAYFDRYHGVKTFIDGTIASARATGKTETLLGRIRLLPEITSSNAVVRQFAERVAVNTPVQGTAADFIKLAMIRMDEALLKTGMHSVMLMTVHDELVFEAPKEEVEQLIDMVRQIMEGIWSLRVPLKVNVAVGDNWAQAHS